MPRSKPISNAATDMPPDAISATFAATTAVAIVVDPNRLHFAEWQEREI